MKQYPVSYARQKISGCGVQRPARGFFKITAFMILKTRKDIEERDTVGEIIADVLRLSTSPAEYVIEPYLD